MAEKLQAKSEVPVILVKMKYLEERKAINDLSEQKKGVVVICVGGLLFSKSERNKTYIHMSELRKRCRCGFDDASCPLHR